MQEVVQEKPRRNKSAVRNMLKRCDIYEHINDDGGEVGEVDNICNKKHLQNEQVLQYRLIDGGGKDAVAP